MDTAAEELCDRVRALLPRSGAGGRTTGSDGEAVPDRGVEEKRMFGTRTFLSDGRILVAVRQGGVLLVRVEEEMGSTLSTRSGVDIAMMGERSMGSGWLDVAPEALADDEALMFWLDLARERDDSSREG